MRNISILQSNDDFPFQDQFDIFSRSYVQVVLG